MQARIGTGMEWAQPLAQVLRRGVAAVARRWRGWVGEIYRPEKHYMRGPGPKWRAKQARAGAASSAGLAPSRPGAAGGS